MRRTKQHQSILNRLLRDERTVPRIAGLLQCIALVLDSETPEEKALYTAVLLTQYGSDPKKIRWSDPEDPPSEETHLSRHDARVTETARELFGNILKERQDDASNRSTS